MVVTLTLFWNDQQVSGTEDVDEDDLDSFDFTWGDGNYACDCNRSRWARQHGADWPELGCSAAIGAIHAKAVTETGRVVFDETV